VELLRGRVETRLAKIESGAFDATYLALAGLRRLGLERHVASIVDGEAMPPAPAQGALAVTVREGDAKTLALFAPLDITEHAIATTCERAFLQALDGSCRTPIAALARISNDTLDFVGEVLTPDGKHRWRRRQSVSLGGDANETARALGAKLGAQIVARLYAGGETAASLEVELPKGSKVKKPIEGSSIVPINMARSRSLFPSSQEVSGSRQHE
jgi:hydroxymethylbilane synthase